MSFLTDDDIKRLAEDKCCGACKHWHRWDMQKEIGYWNNNPFQDLHYPKPIHDESSLHFGDCDKIAKDTSYEDEYGTGHYDGYSFEDESYDDVFHCFEPREEIANE